MIASKKIRELEKLRAEARRLAESVGLDPWPVIFGIVDHDQLNEYSAYDGFPERFPHWSFGMSYDYFRKRSAYSGWWTYELVLNTNPAIAYLRESNTPVENKGVMLHVYAHVDFFKNNRWFSKTPKDMIKVMHTHAERIEDYMNKYGITEVESFLDKALSLQYEIDQYAPFIKRSGHRAESLEDEEREGEPARIPVKRDYMERFVNPPKWLEERRARLRQARERARKLRDETELVKPQKDLLGFLMKHGRLENWQKDILAMIREESYYFVPQIQTKIMNEGWACVVAGTLVFTDHGLIPIEEIVTQQKPLWVSDGERLRKIYDWAKFPNREIMKIRTRRGLTLAGSVTHRIMMADGTWKRLDEVKIGDRVRLGAGLGTWASHYVPLRWAPSQRLTLREVATQAGVSIDTVIRYRRGWTVRKPTAIAAALALYEESASGAVQRLRHALRIPPTLHEELAAFLGYLIGDGHISRAKHVVGFTSGDWEQAQRFKELGQRLFGLAGQLRRDGRRWRVSFYSLNLIDFLEYLGMKTGRSASVKEIPPLILRSPASVVAAFLRAYFDCDAHAGPQGVILSTASESLAQSTQLILLNFGVLSRRRRQGDGTWHIHIAGRSAMAFQQKIGFGLSRKRQALSDYLNAHRFFKRESWEDEIVALERDHADVYDISVEGSHRYAAAGLINHNSYWQAKLMAEFAQPNEFIDHADMMSKVLAGGALNPYALGKLIWEDIKERWDKGCFGRDWELCKDPQKKKKWDTKANLGTEKIFEVRRNYNDVTFLAEFFTEELFERLKLFAYEYIPETGAYHITSRDFADVKKKLLFQHTNLGRPMIKVATGNYGNKGELLLLHMYNGVGLHLEEAKEVLKHIYSMWGRPVNLKTIIKRKVKDPDPTRNRIHPERPLTAVTEEQGVLLRYDGESLRELALSPDEVKDIRLDEDYNTIPKEWIG
uniref:Stage V sporulation protein R n=1 Tax=Acetithermum autotrophicum TaxID=1446466 RepID=H5SRB3_ACEAU|nr:stage V sporulation protein R [Candidatus Acetothermum autotrophicum]